MRKKNNRKSFVKKEELHKVNDKIWAKEVRLVGDNVETEVYSLDDAKAIAEEQGLDLVEISPNASPPVCKVMDYKKFLYEQEKNKPKPQKTVVKEIRFTPNTDDHDLEFKTKHAIGFLEKGAKLKAFVFFKGREMQHKERGELILIKLAAACEEVGTVEAMPKLEGRRMIMWIKPKKK